MHGAIMRAMIKRQVQALAAGVCIGIVVQESAWTGLDLLDPGASLNRLMIEAPLDGGQPAPSLWSLNLPLFGPLFGAWLLGGTLGGLMATLVGRHRFSGHAAGVLLSASAAMIAYFAWPLAGPFVAVAVMPSVGAALGTGLGLRLLDSGDERTTAART